MNNSFFEDFDKNEERKKEERKSKEDKRKKYATTKKIEDEQSEENKVAKWFKYDAIISLVCGFISILFIIVYDISFVILIVFIGNASICFAISEIIQILHDMRKYLKSK